MPAQRFSYGTKFRWLEAEYELKRLLPPPGRKANIENLDTGEVQTVDVATLELALFAGALQIHGTGRSAKKGSGSLSQQYDALDDVPAHLLGVARYRYEAIRPLLEVESTLRTRAMVEARALELAAHGDKNDVEDEEGTDTHIKRKKVCAASLYNWLRHYTEAGNDLRALIPNVARCGRPRQPRLNEEVNALVDNVIQEKYLVPESVTINQVRYELAVRLQELNQGRSDTEQLTLPARSTIARRIDALDVRERFAAKHGKAEAKRKFSQYNPTERPRLPLERVEIDHTTSDLIVIDDADNLPIGRLTLTFALDVATGYPLGYNLGWDKASYLAVAECLYHAICPKEDARARYGTKNEWLAYGVPNTLVTDNGKEFVGPSLRDACELLGIVLQRTPVLSPHFKGGIERQMSTLNTMLLHGLPGTTFSNIGKRGNYDSEKHAAVYLSAVDQLFHIYALDIYSESKNEGIEGIPARRWEHAINTQGFIPRVPSSAQELRMMLGRVDKRSIHHYGIEFEHLIYNSAELAPLRAALRGRQTKIKYNPGDLSRLYVFDPFEEQYIEVPARAQQYTNGLSLWKHQVIVRLASALGDKVDEVALGQAYRKIQQVVELAQDRRSMAARTKRARWTHGGKPTRDIDWEARSTSTTLPTEPAQLPQPGIRALPDPLPGPLALPDASTESVLDIDLGVGGDDEDDGWSIDYSIKPARSHSHLRALRKEDE